MPQVARKLLETAVTLFLMSFFVFMLIGLMPGDPVDLMIAGNPKMTPDDAARLRALYGLDRPLVERYGHWLLSALQGDMGYSRLYGLPVQDVLWPKFLNTGLLLGLSLFLTVSVAVPLGVLAAAREGSIIDRAVNIFCLAGISLPSFWTGLLLMSLLAVKLGWLPASTRFEDGAFLANLRALVLPVLTLTISGLAAYTRHTRNATLEALKSDHIRTARAKGCGRPRVLWLHAFPFAFLPLITLLMLDLGLLFGGALTVETVFAFPGMGKLMFDAVMGNDFNLALSGFLLLTAFVLLANLAADILYRLLDPRVASKEQDA